MASPPAIPADRIASPPTARGGKKAGYPGFVEPTLTTLRSEPPVGTNWLHEIKFDGYRLQAHMRPRQVKLLTRSGLDWTAKFGVTLAGALADLPVEDAIIDGEVVVEGRGGTGFPPCRTLFQPGTRIG